MDESAAAATPTEESLGDPLRDALVSAVGEEYDIVRLIGRGGMGAVYLARDRALERLVAIKVLPPGSATDAGVLERFRREAKTVASLQHVGIVPLYAFGERRGLVWFVMGYVRGESLASRIERETILDVETTRGMLAQIVEALDHAHRQGIVHRDIKPDNILIDDSSGRAMLTDFGIARADTLQAGTSLTQVGSVMGTPHYMSPEQATAEPRIDGRSDLYSVGVVGYQMLSGTLPFDGRSFRELLMQHVSATPKPLATVAPSVPADLAEAVMRCLEKEPAKRYADGRSLRTALGGVASNDDTLTYELAELQQLVAKFLVVTVLSAMFTICAALKGGALLGLPAWLWLTPPLLFPFYGLQVREARQRGYEWSTIRRVLTLPPRWWFLWWPRRWRRSGDVYDQLPRSIKSARWMTAAIVGLMLVEGPLMAWAIDDRRRLIRDMVPGAHAFYSVRWLASLDGLPGLAALCAFLLLLIASTALSVLLVARAVKGYDLGYADRRRLSYKPTDAAFWRDPRIQRVYRQNNAERRPATPQEFVSQILAAMGTLPPSASDTGSNAATAARRLLDTIGAHERERMLLEKTAPREQLERLDAEIVLHESEAGDPEAVALLVNQREALARSRERLQLISTRRDESATQLEALWADVRKLSASTDAAASRELAAKISASCAAVERNYPARRTTSITQRSTTSRLGVLLAASIAVMVRQDGAPAADARALLARGQPDSALAVLATVRDSSAEQLALIGAAHMQRGWRRGIMTRILSARRAQSAFTKVLERDSTRVDALESLAWITRLLSPLAGGSTSQAEQLLRRLERQAPYRGMLVRGYFERMSGRNVAAEAAFRGLVTTAPDSAPAWFALGDLAYRLGKADVALQALRRYAVLMPNDRTTLFHLGELAAVHGVGLAESEVALRDYIRGPILLTQPTVDLAWWRLGQVLEKLGKVEPAREAYRKAIALDGQSEEFRTSLRTLNATSASTP